MSVLRNTSITLGARYVDNAMKAIIGLIVATTLGPAGAGVFALVRIAPHVLASALGGGITIATPYLVGARRYPVQAITEATMAIGVLLSAVTLAGWFGATDLLHEKFYAELPLEAMGLVGLSIPFLLLRNYLNSVQQGLLTFKSANFVLCTEEFITLAFVLPLLWMEDPGLTLVIAPLVGAIGSCLVAAAFLWRAGIKPWPWWHRAIAVEAISFGIRGHIGRVANILTWRLDVMILSAFASVEIVGLYAVASQVAELFRPFSASLTFVLRPMLAALPKEQALERGVFLYRRVFGLNLVCVILMAFLGGHAIELFFGHEFAAAIPAFQILLIGLAAHGADGVVSGYNVGIGRPELNTYTALVGLAVTIVGDLLLIPPYGLIGAAIASSIAYTAKAAAMTALFLAGSGVTVGQLMGIKEYSPDAV